MKKLLLFTIALFIFTGMIGALAKITDFRALGNTLLTLSGVLLISGIFLISKILFSRKTQL
ncbi:hypothetical protein [Flavobacterium sp. JP2137]|uniref:hypothetical protein n=1 Tax=Flavobacterium sp. JP2137 TaxID=3414510 RepID=UPI003D2F9D60